ncbi:SIR2 family protein [Pseudooceanicola nitratireducens]|uniref:SIR2 family protein n=1 Tax=Pseudooceanicola nitratireducens TaxID=517719 RepID=UPI003C79ACB4
MDENLKEALLDAQNGSAVCLLGAGFSRNNLTEAGIEVLDVGGLSDKIWEILDEDPIPNTPLADLADACESDADSRQALTNLLLNHYTLCVPTPDQKELFKVPWRAIFTTNFDDIAERCSPKPQVITPSFDAQLLRPERQPIYHLHGRARDIIEGSLDPSIVLSEANYLKLKDRNRDLYSALENEVHTASRIFFIGYSLRDAEIASRLFQIEGLAERSVVVVGPNERKFSARRLKKFGKVYQIGLDGLVCALKELPSASEPKELGGRLSFMRRFSPEVIAQDVQIEDVHRLIIAGEFSHAAYSRHRLDIEGTNPYCVDRKDVTKRVLSTIASGTNRVLVSSDLGNGKSFTLNEIAHEAFKAGFDVINIEHELPEVFTEVDLLIQRGGRVMFIIDDLIRHRRSARYIGQRLPANCALVVASGSIHGVDEYTDVTTSLGGNVREIDVNNLTHDQLLSWDVFLERWGFWEERIQEDQSERLNFLKERCGAENRAIIVSTFRSSSIASKIKSIVDFFLVRNKHLSKPFIAILINALCRKHVEWSRIVAWLDIDEPALRKAILSTSVFDFMRGTREWYNFTSAELADFILASYSFKVTEVVEVYVKIVRETAYSANDPRSGFDSRENLKELMRFRFLTRLFSGPEDGDAIINAVYHRLSNVPRIRENDQFWLQYAMARMEVGDLGNAETFINTSLGLARKKGLDYSARQIVDQRCRLLFRKNTNDKIPHSRSDISQAVSDLNAALNSDDSIVTHPLRASSDILDFVENKVDDLDRGEIEELIGCVKIMQSKLPEQGRLPKSQKGETRKIRQNIARAYAVLASA